MTRLALKTRTGACRHEARLALPVVRSNMDALTAAMRLHRFLTPGDCNRLNDYVRDLKGSLHALEKLLEVAGECPDEGDAAS
jgi:hypothetical protein